MRHAFILILSLNMFCNGFSQGITLLYKGGGNYWDDAINWIQINTLSGQTPIQRVPTELDDVVFSKAESGLSTVTINFVNPQDTLWVGENNTTGFRCRSVHVSNTDLYLSETNLISTLQIDVSTINGGFVLIDSGSNFRYGHFLLQGGSSEINDIEILNSTFGSLFSHNDWSTIRLTPNGRARFVNSTLGGYYFGSETTGGELYAMDCNINTTAFKLGDNSRGTLLNCTVQNDGNNNYMVFHLGRNMNFVSDKVNVISYSFIDFFTSGSVLNGNVSINNGASSNAINFTQEDTANPLPNIVNGNVDLGTCQDMGISGTLKLSGNFTNHANELLFYPDTSHVFINGQDIFKIGGLLNFGNQTSITNCSQNFCHFTLEFFGGTNSNIFWDIGVPVDTLIINKSGCAKATVTNSLYVEGEARIQSGQLALDPNDTIPYKMVCAGDLNILPGGGVFLRRDANGVVANIAVDGSIHDYNTVVDSACTGFSNPYSGSVTLYRPVQNGRNNLISITSNANIGNLNLIGQTGSDFTLGGNLQVNNFSFINPGKLLLNDHDLVVNGNISSFGPENYFVTNGVGKVQMNNIGNVATVFPVGPSAVSYNPITIQNAGTPDNFSINVQPKVLSGGTNGNAYISGVVNRTWNINESTPGGSNVTLTLQWNAGDELSDFMRNSSYISHYTSGAWNNGTPMPASGPNPYFLTRGGITDFSPFAVMSPAGVIPITLLDFSGSYRDKAVVLNWSTLTESNTRKFTIEKSSDAVLFSALADIPAYGNSQVIRNYDYVDIAALTRTNYYRLKMADINNKYGYSKTISVSAPTRHMVVVFPNPVKDQLFIRLQEGLPESTIRITDAKGIIVRTTQLKAGTTATIIDTKNLEAGVYSLVFNSGALRETLQFIKE